MPQVSVNISAIVRSLNDFATSTRAQRLKHKIVDIFTDEMCRPVHHAKLRSTGMLTAGILDGQPLERALADHHRSLAPPALYPALQLPMASLVHK